MSTPTLTPTLTAIASNHTPLSGRSHLHSSSSEAAASQGATATLIYVLISIVVLLILILFLYIVWGKVQPSVSTAVGALKARLSNQNPGSVEGGRHSGGARRRKQVRGSRVAPENCAASEESVSASSTVPRITRVLLWQPQCLGSYPSQAVLPLQDVTLNPAYISHTPYYNMPPPEGWVSQGKRRASVQYANPLRSYRTYNPNFPEARILAPPALRTRSSVNVSPAPGGGYCLLSHKTSVIDVHLPNLGAWERSSCQVLLPTNTGAARGQGAKSSHSVHSVHTEEEVAQRRRFYSEGHGTAQPQLAGDEEDESWDVVNLDAIAEMVEGEVGEVEEEIEMKCSCLLSPKTSFLDVHLPNMDHMQEEADKNCSRGLRHGHKSGCSTGWADDNNLDLAHEARSIGADLSSLLDMHHTSVNKYPSI